ncbi:MAG: hypothetical protein KAX99_00820 [Azonexus sp.]|nr:hypothetical protein [Azonexus sp.]MBP8168179.1 hypothetical protein [Azonexus sp.]
MRLTAAKSSGNFPPPPIPGDELLIPITSWEAMYAETQVTGVDFEQFWFDSVEDEVAYFFRWAGEPRSTVLVVWTDDGPTHIECRSSVTKKLLTMKQGPSSRRSSCNFVTQASGLTW